MSECRNNRIVPVRNQTGSSEKLLCWFSRFAGEQHALCPHFRCFLPCLSQKAHFETLSSSAQSLFHFTLVHLLRWEGLCRWVRENWNENSNKRANAPKWGHGAVKCKHHTPLSSSLISNDRIQHHVRAINSYSWKTSLTFNLRNRSSDVIDAPN